jgi:hypothetical protein
MTSLMMPHPKRRALQLAILAGLVLFALALCGFIVFLMLHRGPAVAY